MSCDRCKDIHVAQQTGLSGKACECSCHGYSWTYPIWTCTGTEDVTVTSTLNVCDGNTCSCDVLNLNNP